MITPHTARMFAFITALVVISAHVGAQASCSSLTEALPSICHCNLQFATPATGRR